MAFNRIQYLRQTNENLRSAALHLASMNNASAPGNFTEVELSSLAIIKDNLVYLQQMTEQLLTFPAPEKQMPFTVEEL